MENWRELFDYSLIAMSSDRDLKESKLVSYPDSSENVLSPVTNLLLNMTFSNWRRIVLKYKRIRDLREDNDKLQKDIANLLGISQQYYSEYENGNRPIPVQHLITLAKYYNTSIDYIVVLTDNKERAK